MSNAARDRLKASVEPTLVDLPEPKPNLQIALDLRTGTRDRIRALLPSYERINLAVGVVMVALVIISSLFETRAEYGFTSGIYSVVFNIFFLNITHVAFTFMYPFLMPEFRQWWRRKRIWGLSMTACTLLVFSGMTLSYTAIWHFYPMLDSTAQFLLRVLFVIWGYQHTSAQALGYLRIYDYKTARAFGPPCAKAKSYQNVQRICANATWIFPSITYIIANNQQWTWRVPGMWLTGSIGVFAGFIVFATALFEPNARSSNKALFALRFIPYGLSTFQRFWQYYFAFVTHGAEATLLGLSMHKRSLEKNGQAGWTLGDRVTAIAISVFFICLVAGAFVVFRTSVAPYAWRAWAAKETPIDLIFLGIAASNAFSHIHFFIERLTFRLRDPETRDTIGSLL